MFFQNSYLIRTKAGNIDGYFQICEGLAIVRYSALIAVIPDLQFGLVVLINGYVDDDAVGNSILGPLVPAFVEALLPIQPSV